MAGKMDPLHQFQIQEWIPFEIGGLSLPYTNSAFYMTTAVVLATLLMLMGSVRAQTIPGRTQSLAEMFYNFIYGMVRDAAGDEGKAYFPFVFTLFAFILFGNLLGMTPYAFTFTSHIIVTFALALTVFLFVTLIGFYRHGTHFLSLFAPPGVPLLLAPLIIPIEIFSYLARPISLSVRLFANMLAGHIVLKVIAAFITMMGLFGALLLPFSIGFVGFEIFVAFLQAYIFSVLTCVYLHDAVHLH
ncbi:MAG: F0F1 ATP synthase subunit A [Alphaproteobacteria bacterium]|nr:MAG: F0F1 ATP synthase subunit A [Alphaproteobacteria bacterium]